MSEVFENLKQTVKKVFSESEFTEGESLDVLTTPNNVIDLKKFILNCDFIINQASKFNIKIRPMIKTHRSIEGALLQLYGSGIVDVEYQLFLDTAEITVATIEEAEFYVLNGFRNILFPYAPTVDKLRRAKEIVEKGVRFGLTIDNLEVLENVIEFVIENGVEFFCFVDVNPEYNRTGIYYKDEESIELVKRILECEHLEFEGLYLHAGQSYGSHTIEEIIDISELERDVAVEFATKLRNLNITVKEVAIGSTPTVSRPPESLAGITEMHPGNYVFYDVHQCKIGSTDENNISNAVLTRIITKHGGDHPRLVCDAGALALSKDKGPSHLNGYDQWGVIQNHPELRISSISQELGIIIASENHALDINKYKIGSLLKILPNHSCLSSYCFSQYQIIHNDKVIGQWKICPRHGANLI